MARHKLLKENEVSEWLGIPEATLKTHRMPGRAPKGVEPLPFLKMPNGSIRYREDQVNEWIERNSSSSAHRPMTRRTG
jgi:predicted DNA-binding transcriptional regulator AlpA